MSSLEWYGTFSFKLSCGKDNILIDPFVRYDKMDDSLFRDKYYNVDNVLITHGHIDHTLDLVDLYENRDVMIHLTKSPYRRLLKEGIADSKLKIVKPNDIIDIGNIKINVLAGKHIRFNIGLILKTLFNKRIIKYRKNLYRLIRGHLKCKESNETVSYYVTVSNKKILFMGSMAMNEKTIYPDNVDYLVLAYQGRTDLEEKIVPIIEMIKPKNLIFGHFDDSFPPLSSSVSLDKVCKLLKGKTNVIIPEYEKKIEL